MNIAQAKEEIKHSVEAYLKKDAKGNYRIPVIRQRPILMMGPPGIGKTQIMEQIAEECGIGLVAYTITHHTRQSAVGLPMIEHMNYEGQQFAVTEYTMSEIIAGIYRLMKETGKKEGILFIDEINCVSETLTPAMLQFLQCKTFGNRFCNFKYLTDKFSEHISKNSCDNDHGNCDRHNAAKFLGNTHSDSCCDGLREHSDIFLMVETKQFGHKQNTAKSCQGSGNNSSCYCLEILFQQMDLLIKRYCQAYGCRCQKITQITGCLVISFIVDLKDLQKQDHKNNRQKKGI